MSYEKIIEQASKKNYTPLSKEEFAEVKKQERVECFKIANEKLIETVKTPKDFIHYLEVQSRMSQTPTNVMIALAHCENPIEMHDLNTWSRYAKKKVYVKKGSKSFNILEPVAYTNNDGEQAVAFNPKRVFEYSQLTNPPELQVEEHPSLNTLLQALVTYNKINIQAIDYKESGPTVRYNIDTKTMEIMKQSNLSDDAMKQELLHEYCKANLLENYHMQPENTKLLIESSVFMLSLKYNVPTNTEFAKDVIDYFKDCNEDEIRTALNITKDVTDHMSECVSRQSVKEKNQAKESKARDAR